MKKKLLFFILNYFDRLISKINFKTAKIYFNIFSNEKYFEKQSLSQFQTVLYNLILGLLVVRISRYDLKI